MQKLMLVGVLLTCTSCLAQTVKVGARTHAATADEAVALCKEDPECKEEVRRVLEELAKSARCLFLATEGEPCPTSAQQ